MGSFLLGLELGVNALVNTDRIVHAPVDKTRASAHLTVFGLAAGSLGALAAGCLGDRIGLRSKFLLWLLPGSAPDLKLVLSLSRICSVFVSC